MTAVTCAHPLMTMTTRNVWNELRLRRTMSPETCSSHVGYDVHYYQRSLPTEETAFHLRSLDDGHDLPCDQHQHLQQHPLSHRLQSPATSRHTAASVELFITLARQSGTRCQMNLEILTVMMVAMILFSHC